MPSGLWSLLAWAQGHFVHNSDTRRGWVVGDVVDVANALEAGLVFLELVEVERFGLVENVAVGRAHLVCVQVLLRPPCCPVPQLPVALVPSHQVV